MFYETIACIGLTFILKYGTIFDKPRGFLIRQSLFLKDLFDCSLCLGFWTGAAVGGAHFFIAWDPFYYLLPLVSSFLSLVADSIMGTLQAYEAHLESRSRRPIGKKRKRPESPPSNND